MSDIADDSDGGENRRKRIRQACLNCRRKKVRCGGEKPVCTFCSRLSQSCVYVEDGRSVRRTSMTCIAGSEELPEAVMSRLEDSFNARFAALEHQMCALQSTIDKLIPVTTSASSVQKSPDTNTALCPSDLPNDTSLVDEEVPSIAQSPENDRPPLQSLLFAADVYFRFCHNQPYSLFHEPTFRRQLVDGTVPVYLMWALLSATQRYSTLPTSQHPPATNALSYAAKAWGLIELPWDGGSSTQDTVCIIQAIILIISSEHPAGLCGPAYMKLGFALRLALYSNLHLEPGAEMPVVQREQQKRTFWSLYLQDKLISLSRGRFCALKDEECTISLPSSEEIFQGCRTEPPPKLEDFTRDCIEQEAVDACCPLALIAVMGSTLGRVSEYVLHDNRYAQLGLPWSSTSPYATISATLLNIEHYFGMNDDLKDSLERRCFTGGVIDQHLAGSFIYSKALFHLSHCLLHHPFLIQQRARQLSQRTPAIFMNMAWEKCRAHAKSLTDLKDIKNYNVVILTSLYGYCTMVAGTIHVLSMHDEKSSIRDQGKANYKAALEFLQELSCYWSHAGLMANRLERFRLQCESRHQELNNGSPNTEHSPGDIKALWQSVDYALLSAPTRPGSPTLSGGMENLDWFSSPSQLFDFANFTVFSEGMEALDALQVIGDDTLRDSAVNTVFSENLSGSLP